MISVVGSVISPLELVIIPWLAVPCLDSVFLRSKLFSGLPFLPLYNERFGGGVLLSFKSSSLRRIAASFLKMVA